MSRKTIYIIIAIIAVLLIIQYIRFRHCVYVIEHNNPNNDNTEFSGCITGSVIDHPAGSTTTNPWGYKVSKFPFSKVAILASAISHP